MDLRRGYKQTEVGVIPEEWDVKLLPDVCRFRAGKAHEQYISDTGRYVCVNSKFISTDGAIRKFSTANFCPAKKGDVLMVMSDLPNGRALAKAYMVRADNIYAVNQRVCALTAYRDYPEYLFYVLNRNPYFLKFNDGVNQTHLLNHVFRQCPLPVPPRVAEQRAIAAALSDVDALLGGLHRLIAKKRDLKQAAMQQLLTGQTRLFGFHGEWEVKQLADLGQCFAGGTPSTTRPEYWGGSVFWLPSGRIQDNILNAPSASEITITELGLSESAAKRIKPCSVLVAITGATCSNVALLEFEAAANQSVVALETSDEADARFVFYALLMERRQILSRQGGSAQGGVNLKAIKEIEIHCPLHDEQTAIATVLSDMDAELSALETRRAKTRDLKQAMMQELLTGRTRLVPAGAAHA
jgi:type I restriction enzyme S subunit